MTVTIKCAGCENHITALAVSVGFKTRDFILISGWIYRPGKGYFCGKCAKKYLTNVYKNSCI